MAHSFDNALIVFVKNKIRGQVKTRLAKDVGNDRALDIYSQLLGILQKQVWKLQIPVFVYFNHYTESSGEWGGSNVFPSIQLGNDLGEKMANAFNETLQKADKVVIIGSDCPVVTEKTIENAFSQLDKYDVVLGPSEDGGYYLLGMKNYYSFLFSDIHWSTAAVLDETCRKIKENGLTFMLLETFRDVDDITDYNYYSSLGILT
ncbi:MAG: TIGR04282 family arsenosugar biosynthesis glycosyltransferase [Saprospiraceae bacterium]|nr:TIGR04282 family arsenosugar biosynthesis glycosyltransferase [Saprospiraceae bacterium]